MGLDPTRHRARRRLRNRRGRALPQPRRGRVGCLQAPLAGLDWPAAGDRLSQEPPRTPPRNNDPTMTDIRTRSILGYADRFSVAAGERIAFKVSSMGHAHYQADIVRLV